MTLVSPSAPHTHLRRRDHGSSSRPAAEITEILR